MKIVVDRVTEQVVKVPPVITAFEGEKAGVLKAAARNRKSVRTGYVLRMKALDDDGVSVLAEKEVFVKDNLQETVKKAIKEDMQPWLNEIKGNKEREESIKKHAQDAIDELIKES